MIELGIYTMSGSSIPLIVQALLLMLRCVLPAGKYGDGSDVTTWKINFRCSLNSLKDIIERRDLEEADCRVYQMLPSSISAGTCKGSLPPSSPPSLPPPLPLLLPPSLIRSTPQTSPCLLLLQCRQLSGVKGQTTP